MTSDSNPKNNTSSYWRLLGYLKGVRIAFLASIFGYLVFASTQPMLAKLMESIIGAIQAKDMDARWVLPLYAVAIFLVRGIGSFLGDYYNELVGASVVRKLKIELFDHLTVLPASFYDDATHGRLLHRLNNGVVRVRAAITTALKTVVKEGLTVIALLGYVFYLNWKLSLLFLLVAPILGVLVLYTNKLFRGISRRAEGAAGIAMQVSKEMMGNYHVVRGFGAEDYEYSRYEKAVKNMHKTQMRISRVASVFTPLSQLIVAAAIAAIIFLLLTPSVLAESSAGELIGYLTAIALIPKPLRQLSKVTVLIQRGLIGAEMIFGLLDTEAEVDTGDLSVETVKGKITVRNLSFRYPGAAGNALTDINLEVAPGEMVALVGKSGSGKSTLASLLYRLYSVPSKSIYLDDVDINDYQLKNLRTHIAAVNQNVALFDDTIRNNIAYGDTAYSDDEIKAAADQANALEFIKQLEKGLDTMVGEDGSRFSGGQRQRLSIARAFLKNAPVLIMDEATSALDKESERQISTVMESLMLSRTTIVIAHRLSTIMQADRVYVLSGGRVVESGTHHELMAAGGEYHELYVSEFDG
ncbi:MAG: lipid A export permease/ATP-binding protein MsbA [Pseudomonadota bacterium]|nr:lipid A export permease/ATP-binding protein MsbA [Pseudomonadota bacterium]